MSTGPSYRARTTRLKRHTGHGQTQLNNMLVKKSSINEINKEETFTQGFKD